MKRDTVIKLRNMLSEVGAEVEYLNEVLHKEKIFVHKDELHRIARKCREAYDLAYKMECTHQYEFRRK